MVKQETLIIYLHAHSLEKPSWAILDTEGVVRQSAWQDQPDGLAFFAENREVIVLTPAEDVLITTASLPKMSKHKLWQALPYVLEDQLVADIDDTHFAIGEHCAENTFLIAAVAKIKMQEWLSLLQTWQIKPDKLLPAHLALSCEPQQWTVIMHEIAWVRLELPKVLACDPANLAALLTGALQETKALPTAVRIYHTAVSEPALQLQRIALQVLPMSVREEIITEEHILPLLATQLRAPAAVNLLQQQYAVKKPGLKRSVKWVKLATYLGATWLFLLFMYPVMSYFILHARMTAIDTQIAELYKYHFPQANNMVAPKLRMQEKLQKLSAANGENHSLVLLAYAGKALSAAEGINIKRLDYQNAQLSLELNATSSEDIAAFANYLQQAGLSVKQQNANVEGARVAATIIIE